MSQDREAILRISKKKIPQLSIPGNKQEPVYKDKWITNDRAKRNHFKEKCENHQFCSIPYDFVPDKKSKKDIKEERVIYCNLFSLGLISYRWHTQGNSSASSATCFNFKYYWGITRWLDFSEFQSPFDELPGPKKEIWSRGNSSAVLL